MMQIRSLFSYLNLLELICNWLTPANSYSCPKEVSVYGHFSSKYLDLQSIIYRDQPQLCFVAAAALIGMGKGARS
jgi:hypothetical protein